MKNTLKPETVYQWQLVYKDKSTQEFIGTESDVRQVVGNRWLADKQVPAKYYYRSDIHEPFEEMKVSNEVHK